jgi:glycosyltransferase involved in cell wall biosynthesis
MRILQLCHRIPYPPNDGGNIAMLSLTKALASQRHEIKLLTLNTKKHFVDLASLPNVIRNEYVVEAVNIDTSIKWHKAFLNLFTADSYNINRFYSELFTAKLANVLHQKKYDVVLLESLFMAPYINTIQKNSKAKIVLRAHNVEYIIWERLAVNEKNLIRKKYFELLARRIKRYELETINRIDAILPITASDEAIFKKSGTNKPMLVMPVGVDVNKFGNNKQQTTNNKPLSLFHLGAMDWMPNLEGVEWFLKNCWPMIHQPFPALKLFLAGRGFPDDIKNSAPANVICEGEINDAEKYMSDKQLMIVPLLSGSGMRVKIIQGMALGKTIISTSIGAEGINCTDGKNILIANTPEEFLSKINGCINDVAYCTSIGVAAKQLIAEHYSDKAIGERVTAFLEKIL